MKIELRIQQYHGQTDGQTDRHTEWLLELLVGAKNELMFQSCFPRKVDLCLDRDRNGSNQLCDCCVLCR